ncbi:unnamed protein product [Closterium sp. NIES-65]|nr:unnamed protein product [Closterium sp. NIES-65]
MLQHYSGWQGGVPGVHGLPVTPLFEPPLCLCPVFPPLPLQPTVRKLEYLGRILRRLKNLPRLLPTSPPARAGEISYTAWQDKREMEKLAAAEPVGYLAYMDWQDKRGMEKLAAAEPGNSPFTHSCSHFLSFPPLQVAYLAYTDWQDKREMEKLAAAEPVNFLLIHPCSPLSCCYPLSFLPLPQVAYLAYTDWQDKREMEKLAAAEPVKRPTATSEIRAAMKSPPRATPKGFGKKSEKEIAEESDV